MGHEALAAAARRIGATIGAATVSDSEGFEPAAVPLRLVLAAPDRALHTLGTSARLVLESGLSDVWDSRMRCVVAPSERILYAWCLSSATSYHGAVVERLVKRLTEDLTLSTDLLWAFRSGMTEAVANACIHGNLGLSGQERRDPERFADFVDLIERRLEDPHYGQRGLMIAVAAIEGGLVARVWQETGFCPSLPLPGDAPLGTVDLDAPMGRGLMLIQAVASDVMLEDDGRCMRLVFRA